MKPALIKIARQIKINVTGWDSQDWMNLYNICPRFYFKSNKSETVAKQQAHQVFLCSHFPEASTFQINCLLLILLRLATLLTFSLPRIHSLSWQLTSLPAIIVVSFVAWRHSRISRKRNLLVSYAPEWALLNNQFIYN